MVFDVDENITNLIEKPQPKYIPPARYISKFRKDVKTAAVRGKSAHKTFGLPHVPLRPPTEFLKKKTRPEIKRDDIKHKHYHIPGYQHKLPSWEKIKKSKESDGDNRAKNISIKDFKKRNIVNAKKMEPQKPRMFYVDDRRGNAYPLITSGLYPLYRDRKAPTQLIGKKKEIENSKDKKVEEKKKEIKLKDFEKKKLSEIEELKTTKDCEEKISARSDKISIQSTASSRREKGPMCRYVSEEERAELLYGMKKKWDEMMYHFQRLPFLMDTPPKAKKKAKMEDDLRQLEKDIAIIENNQKIFVYEDE